MASQEHRLGRAGLLLLHPDIEGQQKDFLMEVCAHSCMFSFLSLSFYGTLVSAPTTLLRVASWLPSTEL